MITAVLAMAAAYGVHLVYSAVALGWEGLAPGPPLGPPRPVGRVRRTWTDLGLDAVRPADLVGATAVLVLVGGALGYAVFGGVLPPIARRAVRRQLPGDSGPVPPPSPARRRP